MYLGQIHADRNDDRREDAERDPEQQRDRREELIVVLRERAVKLLECILVVVPRAARATELAGAHLFEDAREGLRQFGLLDLVDDEPEATRDRHRRGRADDDRTTLHVDAIDFGPAVCTACAVGKEGYTRDGRRNMNPTAEDALARIGARRDGVIHDGQGERVDGTATRGDLQKGHSPA